NTDVYLAPVTSTSLTFATQVTLAAQYQPQTTGCGNLQATGTDLLIGPPTLAGGSGRLFLLVAYKANGAGAYAMNLYQRVYPDTSVPVPLVIDAAHTTGALNGMPVNSFAHTAAVMTAKGPLLAFLEGPVAQYRAMRYDLQSATFIDPLTGTAGSSVISPS